MKTLLHVSCQRLLFATFMFLSSIAFAQSGPSSLNISGALFNSTGTAITNSGVNFKIEVYDKNATCLMYSEQHLGVDLSATKGAFSLMIGGGTSMTNVLKGTTSFDSSLFLNTGTVAAFTGCPSGLTLNTGDTRLIRVSYNLGSGYIAMTPDIPLTSSAYAMVAETLGGHSASEFLLTNNNSSLQQPNVEYAFSNTNWPVLKSLIDGTSGEYIPSTPTSAVGFNSQRLINVGTPTATGDAATKGYADANLGGQPVDMTGVAPGIGGGKILTWDQTLGKWVAGSTGAVGLVASGTGLTGGPITSSGTLSVDVGVTANKILQLDASARIPAVNGSLLTNINAVQIQGRDISAAAPGSGNLLGWNATTNMWEATPNPGGTVTGLTGDVSGTGSGVISTTINSDTVTSAKIKSTGIAVNRLLITDGSTGATVGYSTCSLGEVLQWSATGWKCESVSLMLGNVGTAGTYGNATQVAQVTVDSTGRVTNLTNVNITYPVTSVNGHTGAVALIPSDIIGLGTAATRDVGMNSGNVLELLTNNSLPAIDGSSLTGINAAKLQGYAIATTSPSSAQVLAWNASSSNWEPTSTATGSVTNVAAGTGLTGGPITSTGTLAVDVGITANKIVQLDSSARLPAVDGSQLTNLAVGSSQWITDSSNIYYNVGSVGIGSMSPGQKLTVNGRIETDGGLLFNQGGLATNNLSYLGSTSSGPVDASMGFFAAGIGSSDAAAGPYFLARGNLFTDIGSQRGNIYFSAGNPSTPSGSEGSINFLSGADLSRMIINNAGNVGIGTTTPGYKLDVAGTINASSVLINGVPVGTGSGSVSNVAAGTGLTGGPITTTGTLNVDVGVTANKIVQLDGSARIPAVDGSQLTNVNATKLQGYAIATTSPTSGQYMGWNNTTSSWQPMAATSGTVTNIATGTGLTGGPISATGTLAVDVGITANKIVQLDGSARLPAVDGSQLTNLGLTSSQWVTSSPNIYYNLGNVGIGTNSPAYKLEVNGASSFGGTVIGAAAGVTPNLQDDGSGNTYVISPNSNGSVLLANGGSSSNALLNANFFDGTVSLGSAGHSATLLVNNNAAVGSGYFSSTPPTNGLLVQGNVGIGTTTPSYKLDVAGTINASSVLVNGVPVGTGSGSVSNIAAGTGLTGGPITTTGTLNVDVGVTANKIVQLDGSARIPAVDGSQLTNVNAIKLQGYALATTSPTSGQYMGWNNTTSSWQPMAATSGTVTNIATGTGLTGGPITTNGTLNVDVGVTANKIVQLDGSARLPAVDGSQLTNLTVASSPWLTTGSNVYYNTGNVGIGTLSPVGYGAGGPILGIRGTASSVPEISLDATAFGGSNWVAVSDTTGNFYLRNVTTSNSPLTLHNNSVVDVGGGMTVGTYGGTNPPSNGMIVPGKVGIGTSSPTDGLDVNATVTNGSSNGLSVLLTTNASNNGSYSPWGATFLNNHKVSSGKTNSGFIAGMSAEADRNDGSSGDSGTLANLEAGEFDYGHWNTDGAATPITTNAYGVFIYPFNKSGTITNMYDLYLGPGVMTGGTTTNHWGVYQAAAGVSNYFGGNVGIGTGTPQAALDVYGVGVQSAMIVPRDTTANRPTTAVNGMIRYASDTNQLESYINGSWQNLTGGGGGGLTSVGLSMPSIFSVTGSPLTANGTLAVAANGTSGGIPYFDTATTMASSAALTNHGLVVGGGAGAAPKTLSVPASGTLLTGVSGADPAFSATPTLGVAGTTKGTLALTGNTSGTVTIQPQAVAGTYNFNLPTSAGSSGQALLSGGGGSTAMSFGTLGVGAGGTGLTSGTSGGIPYFSASNTIASPAALSANQVVLGGGAGTAPKVVVGTGSSGDVLTSNGAGSAPTWQTIVGSQWVTSGSDISYSTGKVGIGTTTPVEKLDVNGGIHLGTTASNNAGTMRWNGTTFQGYNGVSWVDLSQAAASNCDNTVTYSTAGTFGYTVPNSFATITISMWGAGGGGASSGGTNAGNGGNTAIVSRSLVAGGGTGGSGASTGGTGGSASGGDTNTTGNTGGVKSGTLSGAGGSPPSGTGSGGASVSPSTVGLAGTMGGGGSGGSASGNAGAGGGSGGYVQKTYSPATLIPGTVITDIVVGAAGSFGIGTGNNGGPGGEGYVSITCSTTGTPAANNGGILYLNGSQYATDSAFVYSGTNVGIGTASPTQKLDVAGNINATGRIVSGASANSDSLSAVTADFTNTNTIRATSASAACGTLNVTNTSAGGTFTVTMVNANALCTTIQWNGSTANIKMASGYIGGTAVSGVVYTFLDDGANLWMTYVAY